MFRKSRSKKSSVYVRLKGNSFMGGPYASMGLNDAIEADHVFVGEVETTFPGYSGRF